MYNGVSGVNMAIALKLVVGVSERSTEHAPYQENAVVSPDAHIFVQTAVVEVQ